MTDKELKKLGRSDLLEILLEQSKEITALKNENSELRQKLEDRRIKYESAGSLADAAVNISGVMEAAQEAARIYLDNLKQSGADVEEQKKKCAEMEEQSRRMAKRLLDKTAADCKSMREETEKICADMLAKAGKNNG